MSSVPRSVWIDRPVWSAYTLKVMLAACGERQSSNRDVPKKGVNGNNIRGTRLTKGSRMR